MIVTSLSPQKKPLYLNVNTIFKLLHNSDDSKLLKLVYRYSLFFIDFLCFFFFSKPSVRTGLTNCMDRLPLALRSKSCPNLPAEGALGPALIKRVVLQV